MDSSQLSTRAHTLITAVLSYIGFIAAYFIRFYLMPGVINYSFTLYSLMGLASALLHYVIYSLFFYSQMNLYRRYTRLVQRTVLCEILCVGLTLAALFLINLPLVSRMAVFISGVLDTVFICAKHYVVLRAYTALHRSGIYQRNTLLIGEGPTAQRYASTVLAQPEAGHHLVGYVAAWMFEPGSTRLGGYDDLESVLAATPVDEAIIALPAHEYIRLDHIICLCEKYGVPLRIIPCYEERISYQIVTSKFEDIQMIGIRDIPLNRLYNAFIKRFFDILISLSALIVLSPLMLVIAIGVRISTRDTIFFAQTRIGKNKKPFKMLKFRSMRTNDEEDSAWSTNERRPPHVLRRADPQALHRRTAPAHQRAQRRHEHRRPAAGNSAFRGAVPRRGAALHDPPHGQARHDRSGTGERLPRRHFHPRTHRLRYRLY